MGFMLVLDDAGKSRSMRPSERNDCSVRAIAKCLDLPYDAVYSMLLESGRKPNSAFHVRNFLDSHKAFDAKYHRRKYVRRSTRLDDFCATHSTGSYVVLMRQHVAACVGGVVFDDHRLAPYRRVFLSWRLFPFA